jgi:hypothetical protein
LKAEGHEEKSIASTAAYVDDVRIFLIVCRDAVYGLVAPTETLDEVRGFNSFA